MRTFGLIGYPLTHSFSGKYFAGKFEKERIYDAKYELFELSNINDLPALLEKHPDIKGLNVTIPYKLEVIPFLDALDKSAESIGAVNVIKVNDGKLTGYNSDIFGFQKSLEKMIGDAKTQALILGNGGSAKAVKCALENMNISYLVVSRNTDDDTVSYEEVNSKKLISQHQLIINTTPLGMYPNLDACPAINYHEITAEHFAFDLVYNPEKTLFLQKAEQQKARIKNGYEMLVLQAEKSWEIWNS